MSTHEPTSTVLFLSHNYPRFADDFAGRFVARLAELVVARGYRVVVIAPHAPKAALEETVYGVLVRRFRYAPDEQETIAYRGEMGRVSLSGSQSPWAYWRFLRAFRRAASAALAEFNPMAIHAHWWIPGGWVAYQSPGRTRMVLTMHGTDIRMLSRKAWLRPMARRVFRRAAHLTVVSSALARVARDTDPSISDRLSVTPMPPNDAVFYPDDSGHSTDSTPLILCVTRFTEQKRNSLMLRAFHSMRQNGVDARLQFIGEGPLESAIRAETTALGLGGVVTFQPSVSQDQLANRYREADLVVLPAVNEGFGMVLIEAQLCGTAILGARSGGIADIIDHDQTGWLVEPDDLGSLAGGLAKLISDGELRSRLATAGHRAAEGKYSSAAITDQFCQWYTS